MKEQITLLKLETPSDFWAMTSPSVGMSGEVQAFYNLRQEMKDYFDDENTLQCNVNDLEVGMICIGRRPSDKLWYRVKIQNRMQTRSGPQARCLLLDYAQTDMIPCQWLRDAPERFLKVPYQAKHFGLHGLTPITLKTSMEDFSTTKQPSNKWDISATEFVKKLLEKASSVEAEIVCVDLSNKYHIHMYLNQPGEEEQLHVNEELIKQEYAMDASSDATQTASSIFSEQRAFGQKTSNLNIADWDKDFTIQRTMSPVAYQTETLALSNQVDTNGDTGTSAEKLLILQKSCGRGQNVDCSRLLSSVQQVSPNVSPMGGIPGLGRSSVGGVSPPRGLLGLGKSSVDKVSPSRELLAQGGFSGSLSPLRHSVSAAEPGSSVGRGRGVLAKILTSDVSIEDQNKENKDKSNEESEIRFNSPPRIHRRYDVNDVHQSDAASLSQQNQLAFGRGSGVMLQNYAEQNRGFSLTCVENKNECTSYSGYSSADGTSSGEEKKKPRGRLPKKALQQQHEAQERQSTSAGRVHFSENEEILTKKTSPTYGHPSKSILRKSFDSEININLSRFSPDKQSDDQQFPRSPLTPVSQAERLSRRYALHNEVFQQGEMIPNPITCTQKAPFIELVNRGLIRMDYTGPSLVEAFCWPAVLRGRDVVGISSKKEVSLLRGAYLYPLISQILQEDTYSSVPAGNGPLAVILSSSWTKVRDIYDMCDLFIHGLKKGRVLTLFGGGSEENQMVPLINGCEILVAAPHCLLRMLEKGHTNLKRLCHLVLDDADILTEQFTEQVNQIMNKYRTAQSARSSCSAPKQLLQFGHMWTPGMRSFMQVCMQDPILVITSKEEAAVYGQVKQVAYMCRRNQRMTRLLDELQSLNPSSQKIVIFTTSGIDAVSIYQMLHSYSYFSIIAHEDLPQTEIENTQQTWDSHHAAGSHPVLVMTDDVVDDVKIRNADVVVHYDLPENRAVFGNRLYFMVDNFIPSPEKKMNICSSRMFLTEDNGRQAHYIVRLLQRLKMSVPNNLLQLTAGYLEGVEEGKANNLCPYMKAFGSCRDQHVCSFRHVVSRELDRPGNQKQYMKLPVSGEVKVRVSCVVNASMYYAQLLEHRENGVTTPLNHLHTELLMDMALYYASPAHRKYPDLLQINQLYAYEGNDKIFHRVRITRMSLPNQNHTIEKAEVYFIDDGKAKEVKTKDLLQLPVKLAEISPQAVEVFVCRLKPADEDLKWTAKANHYINELIIGCKMDGRIVLSLANTLWLDPLIERSHLRHLKMNINKYNVRSSLLRNALAVDNPEHINLLYKACENKVKLPECCKVTVDKDESIREAVEPDQNILPEAHDYHSVYVSAIVSPAQFYVQRVQDYDKLEAMLNSIDKYMNKPPKYQPMKIVENLLCLSKFSTDGKWYRGRIVSDIPKKDGSYDVFYVDYGDREFVRKEDIHPLPPQFCVLPLQAVEVGIANIVPAAGRVWEEEDNEALWSLSQDDSGMRPLVAKVLVKTSASMAGQHRYEVELSDTNRVTDCNIAQELIVQGHAIGSAESAKILFPEAFEKKPKAAQKYLMIPLLCSHLYQEQNVNKRAEIAKNINGIIIDSSKFKEEIRECGGLKALCTLLNYLSMNESLRSTLVSIINLILNNKRNSEMAGNLGCVHSVWKMLDKSLQAEHDANIQSCLIQTLRHLLCCHSNQEIFLKQRGLSTLIKALEFLEQTKDHENICLAIIQLLQGNPGCWEEIRDSRCVKTLTSLLALSPHEGILNAVSAIIAFLAPQPQMKEIILRDGCVKALCSRLRDVQNEQFLSNVIKALKKLCSNSRPVKEAIISYGGVDALLRLLDEGREIAVQIKQMCHELVTRLQTLTPVTSPCRLNAKKSPSPVKSVNPDLILNPSVVSCSPKCGQKSFELSSDSEEEIPRVETLSGLRNLIPEKKEEMATSVPCDLPPLEGIVESIHPTVQWAQNRYIVLLSVKVVGILPENMETRFTDKRVHFCAVAGNTEYHFEFELYELLMESHCRTKVHPMEVLISLRKRNRGRWPRLLKDKQKPAFLSVDHARFVDSSSESDSSNESEDRAFVLKKVRNPLRYSAFTTLDWDEEQRPAIYKDAVAEGVYKSSDSENSDDSTGFMGDIHDEEENDYFRL